MAALAFFICAVESQVSCMFLKDAKKKNKGSHFSEHSQN